MTEIWCREGDSLSIEIVGHAGYAKYGEDIVCAGISALSGSLAAYLHGIGANIKSERTCPAFFYIRFMPGERERAAYDMAATGFSNIAEKYPQHVVIHFVPQGD